MKGTTVTITQPTAEHPKSVTQLIGVVNVLMAFVRFEPVIQKFNRMIIKANALKQPTQIAMYFCCRLST